MKQNRIWLAMVAFIGAMTLWIGGKAAIGVYEYFRVDAQTVGEVRSWSVEQVGSDHFMLRAVYGFWVGGELYEGESGVPKLVFLNELAAQKKIEQLEKEREVWYSSKNPQVSRLGRVFPYKQCVYSVILLGVLIYFVVLGLISAGEDNAVV